MDLSDLHTDDALPDVDAFGRCKHCGKSFDNTVDNWRRRGGADAQVDVRVDGQGNVHGPNPDDNLISVDPRFELCFICADYLDNTGKLPPE